MRCTLEKAEMNIPQLCHPKYLMTGLGMTVLIFY